MTGIETTPASIADVPPMVFARVLNGRGGVRGIEWTEVPTWHHVGEEVLWLHLDRSSPAVSIWLQDSLGLSDATVELLTSAENRPRAFREGGALVTVLRGINFNPGAKPEDMVSMQIWADATRVVTLRQQRLQTPFDVLATVERGSGPITAGDLVTELVEQTVIKMNRSIVDMNDRIDELEGDGVDLAGDDVVRTIADIRRNCLALKRYMSPQHEALLQIGRDPPAWMSDRNRADIRETIDRLRRYIEDLDVSRESAIVLQDEIGNRADARADRTLYMLSIVAAIFLPLSFVTGLLGVNVGGMPGTRSPDAFWVTVGALAAMMCLQLAVFRKLRWL